MPRERFFPVRLFLIVVLHQKGFTLFSHLGHVVKNFREWHIKHLRKIKYAAGVDTVSTPFIILNLLECQPLSRASILLARPIRARCKWIRPPTLMSTWSTRPYTRRRVNLRTKLYGNLGQRLFGLTTSELKHTTCVFIAKITTVVNTPPKSKTAEHSPIMPEAMIVVAGRVTYFRN